MDFEYLGDGAVDVVREHALDAGFAVDEVLEVPTERCVRR